MGAWGVGISQDDTTADVIGFMVDQMKDGASLEAASESALREFHDHLLDRDDAPLLWIALGEVQWKYGHVDPAVLARVREDVQQGRGLDRWSDDPELLAKRQAALANFLTKIESPNPKPSKTPKRIIRKAPFAPGDCLAVKLSDGKYTAALVLRADNTVPEYGKNLVADLDYYEDEPPGLSVFEQRQWLKLQFGQWDGQAAVTWFLPVRLRKAKKRITVVGRIPIQPDDPMNSALHSGWMNLGHLIMPARQARNSL